MCCRPLLVAKLASVKSPKCLSFNRELAILSPPYADEAVEQLGAVAQLGERCVRNAEVEGSTPFRSTSRNPLTALVSGLFCLTAVACDTPFASITKMRVRQNHHGEFRATVAESERALVEVLSKVRERIFDPFGLAEIGHRVGDGVVVFQIPERAELLRI